MIWALLLGSNVLLLVGASQRRTSHFELTRP